MADTLGSLCDKLTIVELKSWHTGDPVRLDSLTGQRARLTAEIDEFVAEAAAGHTDPRRLTFAQNKVFELGDRTIVAPTGGGLGDLFGQLAHKNCELWHEQEKVYELQKSPDSHHDAVELVARLGQLNLERCQLIDAIDESFVAALSAQGSIS